MLKLKNYLIIALSLTLLLSGLPLNNTWALTTDDSSYTLVTRSYDPDAIRMVVEIIPSLDVEDLAATSRGELVRTGPLNYCTIQFGSESIDSVYYKGEKLQEVLDYPGVLSAQWSETYTVHNELTPLADTEYITTGDFSVMDFDPEYTLQWYLRNIRADKVWDEGATGQGVIVAVVDTGVDLTNPEFKDSTSGRTSLVPGYNAFTRSSDPQAVQDDNGHGTSTSGVTAALKDNNKGIVGIAHNAKVMPIKAMDEAGEGEDSIIADGIIWAVDNGAKIINLSIGSEAQSKILDDALKYAVNKGCLLVGASGNKKGSVELQSDTIRGSITNKVAFPGADPNVLAVSAVDRYDNITDFSLLGPEVRLSAPGNRILTTFWSETDTGLAYSTGTSIATPMVSAAAALLWSGYPELSAQDIEQAMFSSASDQGARGQDDQYGFGRVDVYRAFQTLQEQRSYSSPASLGWEGGKVYTGGTPAQPTAELSIQPGTFNLQVDNSGMDGRISFSISDDVSPADFPTGIIPAGDTYSISHWGEELLFKPLTLSLRLTPPGEEVLTESTISYLYRWNNNRWIRVGGGVAQDSSTMEVTIYEPGTYRAGWSAEPQSDRIFGTDRISTALEIAKEAFPTGADTVIIARADSFPDALAGAPLAYQYHAPILLTFPENLPEEVYQTIEQLAPQNIIILGGTGAVSTTVEEQLENLTYVSRIAGPNRYATAAAIAEILGNIGEAVVVNSFNFPDAIAAASHAAYQGKPILLTPADDLHQETADVLKRLSVTDTQVIGGTSVITPKVYGKLIHPTRLSGANRFATSAAVIQANPSQGRILYIATGMNFPDALTGGVLATTNSSNILLIPKDGPIEVQIQLLQTLQGRKVVALGGEGAVSIEALEKVQELVE